MKILIAYATTEGQTRKIARWVADRIFDQGHTVELAPLSELEGIKLARFDGVILAASIHLGNYQSELTEFAHRSAMRLSKQPTLFLSVSLAAAGHDAEDWGGLERTTEVFQAATGWSPDRLVHVAGAYKPSKYDMFQRFVMRRVIAQKDPDKDLSFDHEYTDWAALGAEVDSWLAALSG
ncbi:hypothetical protein GCM10016455_15840 [Aliiroseovarius zhejiangensis]|uniref:Flavodoxin-like domain-containing protein n=1 Tax=Aliiroseovarius zhejiangensis TaxID=1632025 RepID=A0ABQ3IXX4_9RHOB|nr:flavodoxin domain-containing protein [Aliiroseovarius zhejiangensis]GHE96322.1 hypothetical protein GCM10016455_15840 [Aliiroseovarius zhejiangensis]